LDFLNRQLSPGSVKKYRGIAGCKDPLSEANVEKRQLQWQMNSEALILKEGGN
jgi:hypothetical protein